MSNYPAGVTGNEPEISGDNGYSDFASDYEPDDDQLEELFSSHFDKVIELLRKDHATGAYMDIQALWKDENEDKIEEEWDTRND